MNALPIEVPSDSHLCQHESWAKRYGVKHRWVRFTAFPVGIVPPQKVRVYRRADHFLLNWWDPAEKKNLSERVSGDLLAVLARARQLDERVTTVRRSGVGATRRLSHAELVRKYLTDMERRADAGEIDPKTVRRYQSALAHYADFAAHAATDKKYPTAGTVDRAFRLAFTAYLSDVVADGSGRAAPGRHLRDPRFVLDAVRALYAWGCDPDRGRLLPDGFRNPFLRHDSRSPVLKGDPLAGPDISVTMAIDLVRACDAFQLRLFVPLLLFGLRAAEPCILFADNLDAEWLSVPCVPDLGILTKGRRDKRFPLMDELAPFWNLFRNGKDRGLLLERRAVAEGGEAVPLRSSSVVELITAYKSRCARTNASTAASRSRVRDAVLKDAGGLNYDLVHGEFVRLTKALRWPAAATLKDLRHLFATTLNNAGVPEGYRRYLLGHAPGTAAILAYTHLDQLRRHYASALRQEWPPLIDAINERATGILLGRTQEGNGSDLN